MNSDSTLQRRVLDELRFEPQVNAADIGVSVKEGIVTLSGHVSSYPEKYAAQEAAKRVAGVRAVANEIDVKLPDENRRTDEDLAIAAANALRANALVPFNKITVSVNEGWVKLEGEVEWEYQKEAAEQAIRNIPGVAGLSNLIRVKPVISPTDVQAKIKEAFERSAESDAHRIRVEVEDGKVVLRGRVRSLAEKVEARRIAWSAPGISKVEDKIIVRPPKPRWMVITSLLGIVALLFVLAVWPRLLLSWRQGGPSAAPDRQSLSRDAREGWPADEHLKAPAARP